MTLRKKQMIRFLAGIFVGGLLGFLYYRFIGCTSGACPITKNPYVSTIYGALLGGLIAWGT
jgi:hypothetical protein